MYSRRTDAEAERISTKDLDSDLRKARAGKKTKASAIVLLTLIANDYVVVKRVRREQTGIFLVQNGTQSHAFDL